MPKNRRYFLLHTFFYIHVHKYTLNLSKPALYNFKQEQQEGKFQCFHLFAKLPELSHFSDVIYKYLMDNGD